MPTLTFAATAFAVTYTGAEPVFIDVERDSWNMDPELLEVLLSSRSRSGKLPAAVIAVDLFGRTCDYDNILESCRRYGVQLITDAAESLGAIHGTAPAASFGDTATLSFNGNKIITTSGGGALVTNDASIADKVRKWSTQSREPCAWYEHTEIGFNYRMSNLLAALGRSQLSRLPSIVAKRRALRDVYDACLQEYPGLVVMGDPPWGLANGWLVTAIFDSGRHPGAAERVRVSLEKEGIEARPVWKPMHLQPVFRDAQALLSGVAEKAFMEGLCLPTGTDMTRDDVRRVCDAILRTLM